MPGLKGLKQIRPKKQSNLEKAVLKPRGPSMAGPDDEVLPNREGTFGDLVRRIGEKNARIVRKWLRRGQMGSSPELLVFDWLTGRRIEFEFQSSLYGGRQVAGGLVTDFIVWAGSHPMAWWVQGTHWHGSATTKAKDRANRQRMLVTTYGGRRFVAVIGLAEADLYKRHQWLCEEALRGHDHYDW